MPCWCGRQHHGFGFTNKHNNPFDTKYHWFCSLKHMKHWKGHGMIDPTKNEIEAMTFAGQMAGEYMQEIGKTDLATFTKDEWMTLLKVIYGNTTAKLSDLEIPF